MKVVANQDSHRSVFSSDILTVYPVRLLHCVLSREIVLFGGAMRGLVTARLDCVSGDHASVYFEVSLQVKRTVLLHSRAT